MKRAIIILIVIGFLSFSYDGINRLRGSDEEEKLRDILARTVALTATVYAHDYRIAHMEVDRLERKEHYRFQRKLYSSNVYKIIGVGGQGIKDLDIKIYDSNGNLLAKDTSEDNFPEITVDINETDVYTIEAIAFELEDDADQDAEYFFVVTIGFK